MTLANPLGLTLLALAAPIVVLHVLRPRRQAIQVSSTYLWRVVDHPVSSATPWQRLRASWLLLVQLLAVVAFAVAVARPVRETPARLAGHTVFILDASGSMAALDEQPDRLGAAKEEARRLREELPEGGVASIVVAGDRARVVLTTSDDRAAFDDALDAVEVTASGADFADAFALATSLETPAEDVGFVLISDGGLSEEEQRLQPAGTVYRRIGSRDVNRAITRLGVEPRGSGLHVRVSLENTGGPTVTQPLRIDVDGLTVHTADVELKPGATVDHEVDVPGGDRVEAFLVGDDLLATDDRAVAVGGRRRPIDVLLAGDTAFVGELLAAIPEASVTVTDEAAPTGEGFDVVVYNGVAVPAEPAAPFLAIAPPGGSPGVDVVGQVEQPAVTLLRDDDPLVEGLDVASVGIVAAQRVTATTAETLIGAEGAPLLLRGAAGGQEFAYLSFALADSNLPVQVVFPLLGDRLLTDLAGTAAETTALTVGDALPTPAGIAATVLGPGGQTRSVGVGAPAPRADRPGFWTITGDDGNEVLAAVNPPSSESALAPADELIRPPPAPTRPGDEQGRGQQPLVVWFLVALLALLVTELLLARRAVGVGRRQWRLAVAARAVIAALLVVAIVAPQLRRPSDRTATVFLVDVSASLGPGGREAAVSWVANAVAGRGDDDLTAVVAFGAEARLDRVLQASSDIGTPQVVVDASATNLAAALRLGDAVLPDDARRRIVVVSDGKQTAGDATEELDALVDRGTVVDVHAVEVPGGLDAAVRTVDAPRLARAGEAVDVEVSIEASGAGTGVVVLRRDGQDVAEQAVTLVAGDNAVTFSDVPLADPGAVLRYQAELRLPGDVVAENDVGFAAVPVEGPARVLVVEGAADEGAVLADALEAGGVVIERVGVGDLPDLRAMVAYSAIVLVDVDARELTGDQVETLQRAVRDLGRGLVTVGGERSYGLGGYRGTPLEDLLPVVSEILDPQRRKIVAQVLSIDVSGSMANCHCDEGEVPDLRADGGVNKTDISRAAAARTIEALSSSDEIGILAWNESSKWVVDLQTLPAEDVVEEGLRQLVPAGGTNLGDSLTEAAAALRASRAGLKHIIMFSDGFTDPAVIDDVAEQAGELHETDGITVSVIATGEGAAPSLEDIAVEGHGRFYPGRDLDQVPQVIAEEAVIASRDFINEGEFLPAVTAATAVTEDLTSAPPLLGYVATTAKGTATTALRIGPDRDPLLATWNAGLGRVSSWTSDASAAWSQPWTAWDGYVSFWSLLVKDTFPAGDTAGAAQATLRAGTLQVTVEDDEAFPDGATAVATVAGPDGQRVDLDLERTEANRFGAEVPVERAGSYAVGITVRDGPSTVLSAATLASESYPAEYRPGPADAALLAQLSAATSGRGEIAPAEAFDAAGLTSASRSIDLRGMLLLVACLLWPLAVVLSRWSLRGASLAGAAEGARSTARRIRRGIADLAPVDPTIGAPRPPPSPPGRPTTGPPAGTPTAAVSELLAQQRARRRRDDERPDDGDAG